MGGRVGLEDDLSLNLLGWFSGEAYGSFSGVKKFKTRFYSKKLTNTKPEKKKLEYRPHYKEKPSRFLYQRLVLIQLEYVSQENLAFTEAAVLSFLKDPLTLPFWEAKCPNHPWTQRTMWIVLRSRRLISYVAWRLILVRQKKGCFQITYPPWN